MAMTKSTGLLVVCVLGLSIACVGLLVALLVKSDVTDLRLFAHTQKFVSECGNGRSQTFFQDVAQMLVSNMVALDEFQPYHIQFCSK